MNDKLAFAPYDLVADHEFLSAAHRETFMLTFKKELKPEWLESELNRSRDVRDGAYLNGKLIGLCDLQRHSKEGHDDYGYVGFFFIAPEYRNRGFGGQLITHSVKWCRSQGLKTLTLRTGKDNYRAQRSYEKNGFVRYPATDTENEIGYTKKVTPFSVRIMTINDYDAVYRLWTATPGMGLNNLDDSREGIIKYLKRNPATCFVAESAESEIIGVILCGHDGRRGYIYHTAVAVTERKQGVGSALVSCAVHALQDEGIAKAALVVFSKNEIGDGFWEQQEFTLREDINYRNKTLDVNLLRMNT